MSSCSKRPGQAGGTSLQAINVGRMVNSGMNIFAIANGIVLNIFPLFIIVFMPQLSFELLDGGDDGSPILKVKGRLYFTLTKESP